MAQLPLWYNGAMKNLIRLLVSVAVSALIVGLLFGLLSSAGSGTTSSAILSGLRNALPAFVAIYIAAQIVQATVRAQRALVLLRASCRAGTRLPSLFHMTLVTFVRGACADMLPARLGELSYVAMLNRGCAVPAADCFSSLSIGLLFDFIALLAVLAVAIPGAAQGLSLVGSLVMLAIICAVGLVLLFGFLPWFAGKTPQLERFAPFRWKPVAALLKLIRDVADAVVAVRRQGVAAPVVGLSILIRAAKYGGLYFLFVAVTRPAWPELSHAGVFAVLVALIAAEGAASLPVPTFMSFGSYEAGGLAALTALGFGAADSMAAMLTMHVLSQVIDYSAGGLAFLLFTWLNAGTDGAAASKAESASRPRRLAIAAAAVMVLGLALLFAAYQFRAAKKRGRLTRPPAGVAVAPTAEEAAARDAILMAFGGKIVWSSNREGSHDIWILDGPGKEPRRLTHSDFTDTYPRFSPDGRLVSFSRSTEPWISQRNFDKWDTWVIDLETGRERLVATNAYQACWNVENGRTNLVFVRNGGKTLGTCDIFGRIGLVELVSGQHPLEKGEAITLPDTPQSPSTHSYLTKGDILVTLRGARNATAHIDHPLMRCEPEIRNTAGGCQMVWRRRFARYPHQDEGVGFWEEEEVVWVDHPGRMKNAFYTFDYSEADCEKRKRVLLFDAEEPWSHEYFPRFAEGGRWLVYGASQGGHEQDSEDYEIFLWDSANTNTPPVRITFHTGNDCWPDILGK